MRIKVLWQSTAHTSPFGSRILLTAGTNGLSAVLGLLTGILAARLLGPQGRGELAAIQTWPSFIATLAMLGLPDALVYYSAREPRGAGSYLSTAIALALLTALPFMVTGYLLMPFLLSAQRHEVVTAAQWYLLLIPIFALVGMPYHPLRGLNDFALWNTLRLLPTLMWLVILTWASLFEQAVPQTLAASYLGALALLFVPVVYLVSRRIPGPFWPKLFLCRKLLHYGLPSMVSSVPQMLNLRLDQMVMATFLPAQVLGLYMVAVAWGGATHPLMSAVGAVIFPRVAEQANPSRQREVFVQGIRMAGVTSLVIAMPFLLVTPLVLPLVFGKQFSTAIPAALVLVVAGAIAGLNTVFEEGLRGLGQPVSVLWAECGGVAVAIVSLLILLKPLAIMGAALASLLGYSATALFLVMGGAVATGYSPAALLLPKRHEVSQGWHHMQKLAKAIRIF